MAKHSLAARKLDSTQLARLAHCPAALVPMSRPRLSAPVPPSASPVCAYSCAAPRGASPLSKESRPLDRCGRLCPQANPVDQPEGPVVELSWDAPKLLCGEWLSGSLGSARWPHTFHLEKDEVTVHYRFHHLAGQTVTCLPSPVLPGDGRAARA